MVNFPFQKPPGDFDGRLRYLHSIVVSITSFSRICLFVGNESVPNAFFSDLTFVAVLLRGRVLDFEDFTQ